MRLFQIIKAGEINLKCLIFFIIIYPILSLAQIEESLSNPEEGQNGSILVYIDYSKSDNTERYLRSEIPFATYVRDPQLAQIHILIVDQHTGSGGKRFNISFIGKDGYEGQGQTLFYISPQSDSDDQQREGLARTIKMGLMPYVSQTSIAEQIEIRYDEDKVISVEEIMHDSWDYWVFSIDLSGGLKAEESRDAYNISTGVKANRVTEAWKFQNEFTYKYEEENFTDDDESLKSFLKEWKAESKIVKSLGIRWSAGLFADAISTTYKNIRMGWSVAPTLEFNFFPWPESERRKFTIAYQAGLKSMKYFQITLFDKFADNLFYHALDLELEMTQPWGKIDFEVEASQYLEMKDLYSLKFDIELDFRISSGLEFVLNSKIESIHNQIYLPRGDATIDEILLRRRQLATTYEVEFKMGLRFTFGSIYNNIINERL
jgi:hypothetical protein